jgi:hypothetical protein
MPEKKGLNGNMRLIIGLLIGGGVGAGGVLGGGQISSHGSVPTSMERRVDRMEEQARTDVAELRGQQQDVRDRLVRLEGKVDLILERMPN